MAARKYRVLLFQRSAKRASEDMYLDPRDDKILTATLHQLAEQHAPRRVDLSEWSLIVHNLSGSGVQGRVMATVTVQPNGQIRIRR